MSKRKRSASVQNTAKKRSKPTDLSSGNKPSPHVLQPLLAQCYNEVKPLKDYLLGALPAASRVRRKRLSAFVESLEHAYFFKTTLVGLLEQPEPTVLDGRLEDLARFTQRCRGDHSLTAATQNLTIEEVSLELLL